jgi:acyl carrier protein
MTTKEDSMTDDHVYATLTDILSRVSSVASADISPEADPQNDLGIDSLAMLEVAVQAEDALGIRVDDGDLAGLRTVSDAANYLQDRTAPAVR